MIDPGDGQWQYSNASSVLCLGAGSTTHPQGVDCSGSASPWNMRSYQTMLHTNGTARFAVLVSATTLVAKRVVTDGNAHEQQLGAQAGLGSTLQTRQHGRTREAAKRQRGRAVQRRLRSTAMEQSEAERANGSEAIGDADLTLVQLSGMTVAQIGARWGSVSVY